MRYKQPILVQKIHWNRNSSGSGLSSLLAYGITLIFVLKTKSNHIISSIFWHYSKFQLNSVLMHLSLSSPTDGQTDDKHPPANGGVTELTEMGLGIVLGMVVVALATQCM